MNYTCMSCGFSTDDYPAMLEHLMGDCKESYFQLFVDTLVIIFFALFLSSCSTLSQPLQPGESREITAWGVAITMETLIVGYWHSYRGPPGKGEDSAKPGDVIKPKPMVLDGTPLSDKSVCYRVNPDGTIGGPCVVKGGANVNDDASQDWAPAQSFYNLK